MKITVKYITVKLTEDQLQFLINVTDVYLEKGVHQERLAFAGRLKTTLVKAITKS